MHWLLALFPKSKEGRIWFGVLAAILLLSSFWIVKYGLQSIKNSIKKFFGINTGSDKAGDKDNVIVLGDDFELPVDSTLTEMTINSLVSSLSNELTKTYWVGFGNASSRCEILKKVNSLNAVDLRVIVFAYNKSTKRHLRNDVSELTITGTCNDDSDGDVHKKSLIERIDRL